MSQISAGRPRGHNLVTDSGAGTGMLPHMFKHEQSASSSSADQNVRPSDEIPEIERRISRSQSTSLSNSTSSDH